MPAQPASGRVVLLTGAAGGIGTAMTRALLAAGHSVAAVDRDRAGLEKLAALAAGQAAGARLHAIVAELESARDPALGGVASPDPPVAVVEAAAVAVDEPARGVRDQLAERRDAVLERHPLSVR